MPTQPTPPIELLGHGRRLSSEAAAVPAEALDALSAVCPLDTGEESRSEHGRDWWPLSLHWALRGEVPQPAGVVAFPRSTEDVVAVMKLCTEHRLPVTPSGGRSGVCGAAVPAFGGVVLDLTGLSGVESVDAVSGVVEVRPGTFGPELEDTLRAEGLTVGHFPQSFDLATVGGWVASRGAGQYSTRYGKIEDIVVGLEAVLADGTIIRTGGAPAAAEGPDLTQLLVGSEGTLAVITNVWLRAHPLPGHEQRAAYSFPSFSAGVEACRRVMRAGATPAVLRLYDGPESARGHGGDGKEAILLVLDEGDRRVVAASMDIVAEAAGTTGGRAVDDALVDGWLEHRNDTSALQGLTRKGFVVDTMEVAGPWIALDGLFDEVRTAMMEVEHAVVATCHLSHSYLDGACLYFTFAATPPLEQVESTYVALWDAGQRTALRHGGNLSHHHGVGLNRARFARDALGPALGVLQSIKDALDPLGILNPGKLGLTSPFGEVPWP